MATLEREIKILKQQQDALKQDQTLQQELRQEHQTLRQEQQTLKLKVSRIERAMRTQKGVFDHDSSLSVSSKCPKPQPHEVAKHYGWDDVELYLNKAVWKTDDKTQYCMVKYGNRNSHTCEGAFLNPSERIVDSTHTVPLVLL